MRRPRLQSLLVWTLACWQVLLLAICVPAASARPTPAELAAAHACCHDGPTLPTDAQLACPHCSDGHGRFVDGPSPAVMLAPDALVERTAILPREAASTGTLADERPIYRPPDASLFALRCALIR